MTLRRERPYCTKVKNGVFKRTFPMPQQTLVDRRGYKHTILSYQGRNSSCQNESSITQQKIQIPLKLLFRRIKLKASSHSFPHRNVTQTLFDTTFVL